LQHQIYKGSLGFYNIQDQGIFLNFWLFQSSIQAEDTFVGGPQTLGREIYIHSLYELQDLPV